MERLFFRMAALFLLGLSTNIYAESAHAYETKLEVCNIGTVSTKYLILNESGSAYRGSFVNRLQGWWTLAPKQCKWHVINSAMYIGFIQVEQGGVIKNPHYMTDYLGRDQSKYRIDYICGRFDRATFEYSGTSAVDSMQGSFRDRYTRDCPLGFFPVRSSYKLLEDPYRNATIRLKIETGPSPELPTVGVWGRATAKKTVAPLSGSGATPAFSAPKSMPPAIPPPPGPSAKEIETCTTLRDHLQRLRYSPGGSQPNSIYYQERLRTDSFVVECRKIGIYID